MPALSIRNRIQYIALGVTVTVCSCWLAYYVVKTEGDTADFAALIVVLFGIAIGRQLIFFSPNISILAWWEDFSSPATVGKLEDGTFVFERWLFWGEYAEIYNTEGFYIGSKKCTLLSDEYGTHIGERVLFSPKRIEQNRLSWLARLRSPKLPAGQIAEVIDGDNSVVGHTTYSER